MHEGPTEPAICLERPTLANLPAAVRQLYDAIRAGNGTGAQFSHPEFGGMGQWIRSGMMMIGDMFNQNLKGRVDALCNDLSAIYFAPPALAASTTSGWANMGSAWWPASVGRQPHRVDKTTWTMLTSRRSTGWLCVRGSK